MARPLEDLKGADILVVDDTPANLKMLSSMLKEQGYKARPVPSGKLALKAAENNPPDLILLDINMPEMDGYEVCRHLKESEMLRDIPIIFISALTETMDKVKAFKTGGVDYVTKPFQFEEVQARVETHLKLRDAQIRLQHDIIELKRAEDHLRDANQKLRELESLKEDLISMIVHDMKNPVTNTMLALDMIGFDTDIQLSEQQNKHLLIAKRNQFKLSEMMANLLEISRLESGHIHINETLIDLEDLINLNVQRYAPLLGVGEQTARISFHPDAKMVSFDKTLVERIFSNMLSNAIQHSAKGGEILVTVTRSKDQSGISISVQDFGEGIPKEYHERIFEKFSQVGLRREGQTTGTGLGLAFCRMAAEALGGAISVESEPGKGSCFTLLLPAALPSG